MIGRELEGRKTVELFSPVGKLIVEVLALEPFALPERIIGVLDR